MKIALAALIVLLTGCPKSKTTKPVEPFVVDPTPDDPPPDEPPVVDDPGAPRFANQDLGASGISAYLPRDFPEAKRDAALEDSGEVYVAEMEVGDHLYGYVAVSLAQSAGNAEDQQSLLVDYLDYLQGVWGITGTAGYGFGWTTDRSPAAIGVIDYWSTSDDLDIEVIGWVTETHIAVLYIAGEDINPSVREVYFKGVTIP
jgi:hypothetical protein